MPHVQVSGVKFRVGANTYTLRGTLSLVTGDNLGIHFIGGYKQLSSALRKCRHCMAVAYDMAQKVELHVAIYTVNLEIFVVKIFSWSIEATKIKIMKLKRMRMLQCGTGSFLRNIFTRKYFQRKFHYAKISGFMVHVYTHCCSGPHLGETPVDSN